MNRGGSIGGSAVEGGQHWGVGSEGRTVLGGLPVSYPVNFYVVVLKYLYFTMKYKRYSMTLYSCK